MNEIKSAFSDTSEITIKKDKFGIISIKGIAYDNSLAFKISLTRNESGNTLPRKNPTHNSDGHDDPIKTAHKAIYTGTISLLDPASSRIMLSEAKKRKIQGSNTIAPKRLYCSKQLNINSTDESEIRDRILKQANKLKQENQGQLMYALGKALTRDTITPKYAFANYANEFLSLEYSSSPENNHRYNQLHRATEALPCLPISKISKREAKKYLKKHKIPDKDVKLLNSFFQFLIATEKVIGTNPIPTDIPQPSDVSYKRAAFLCQEIEDVVFQNAFIILNSKYTLINIIISLLFSNFSVSELRQIKFSDLIFDKKNKDHVIVRKIRDYAANSKHDLSRPVIPDTALYLNEAIPVIQQDQQSEYIVPPDISTPYISNELNNLLVRAGFRGTLSLPGRPDKDETIPLSILKTNYQRMLIEKAGLANDPDTFHYLCGDQFRNSTFLRYESHSDSYAQKFLYQCLKPVSVEKRIKKKSGITERNNDLLFSVYPKSNHEVSRVTGTIVIPPDSEIVIKVAHGARGYVESRPCEVAELDDKMEKY